jgi:hypothetical protein
MGHFSHPGVPKLNPANNTITSSATYRYNCIGWAANDDQRWWWPTPKEYFWPAGVPREVSVQAFVAAYATLGYEVCEDGSLDPNYEKVALYWGPNVNGIFEPTHGARQKKNGRWTSKLGPANDIEHHTAQDVEGPEYGQVVQYLRRPRATSRVGKPAAP